MADHVIAGEDVTDMFFAVEERTDLASLAVLTRQRLVPLMFAGEVARHHGGALEISLWEQQALAARLTIPQAVRVLQ